MQEVRRAFRNTDPISVIIIGLLGAMGLFLLVGVIWVFPSRGTQLPSEPWTLLTTIVAGLIGALNLNRGNRNQHGPEEINNTFEADAGPINQAGATATPKPVAEEPAADIASPQTAEEQPSGDVHHPLRLRPDPRLNPPSTLG